MVRFIADHKQKLKKLLPKKLLRAAKLAYLKRLMAKYQKEPIHPAEYQKKEAGVNLIGDIRAEIGLGQSMRLLANELELSEIPFGIYNFQLDGNVRRGDHSFEHRMREDYPYRVNLFHVNPQEVGLAYLYLNKEIWRDRYNIAFWLWELEEFPQEYQEAIKFFDEIWTPSEFASSSIRKVTDKPVYTLPYYVTAGKDENCGRADFGLPEDKFLYLIMYDTNSTMARKNPVGALDAYKKAFPVEDEHVGLVIKMNNPKQEDLEVLREQTKGYQNVYLIAEVLDKPKVNSLIAAVDVFVSLHRARPCCLTRSAWRRTGRRIPNSWMRTAPAWYRSKKWRYRRRPAIIKRAAGGRSRMWRRQPAICGGCTKTRRIMTDLQRTEKRK